MLLLKPSGKRKNTVHVLGIRRGFVEWSSNRENTVHLYAHVCTCLLMIHWVGALCCQPQTPGPLCSLKEGQSSSNWFLEKSEEASKGMKMGDTGEASESLCGRNMDGVGSAVTSQQGVVTKNTMVAATV